MAKCFLPVTVMSEQLIFRPGSWHFCHTLDIQNCYGVEATDSAKQAAVKDVVVVTLQKNV